MNKAIIWGRVSTVYQEVEEQVNELIELSIKEGFKREDLYIIKSKGASAIKQNDLYQQEIEELINTLKKNTEYKTVYVWEISRLARIESTFHIIKEFLVSNKIQLVVKNPYLRLLNTNGELDFGVGLSFSLLASFASQEMEIKKKRFTRGKQTAKNQGKFVGGRFMQFGYKKDKDGYIIVDEKDAETVRLIFSLYAFKDMGCRSIYKYIQDRGLWTNREHSDTVQGQSNRVAQIIKNKRYLGTNTKGYIYPPIVDEDVWNKANEKLANIKSQLRRTPKNIYLGKKLLCCEDGSPVNARGNHFAYQSAKISYGYYININCVESIVWDAALQLKPIYDRWQNSFSSKKNEQEKKELTTTIKFRKDDLDSVQKKIDRLNNLYVNGKIRETQYNDEWDKLNKEQGDLNNEIIKLQTLIDNVVEAKNESYEVRYARIESVDNLEVRRQYINEVIDKIVVTEIADKHYRFEVKSKFDYLAPPILWYECYHKSQKVFEIKRHYYGNVGKWFTSIVPVTMYFKRKN